MITGPWPWGQGWTFGHHSMYIPQRYPFSNDYWTWTMRTRMDVWASFNVHTTKIHSQMIDWPISYLICGLKWLHPAALQHMGNTLMIAENCAMYYKNCKKYTWYTHALHVPTWGSTVYVNDCTPTAEIFCERKSCNFTTKINNLCAWNFAFVPWNFQILGQILVRCSLYSPSLLYQYT